MLGWVLLVLFLWTEVLLVQLAVSWLSVCRLWTGCWALAGFRPGREALARRTRRVALRYLAPA